MNITEMLEQLADLYAQRDLLGLQQDELLDKAIPPEVQKAIDDINLEFADKKEVVAGKIIELEGNVRGEVKQAGMTVKGSHFQAVYAKGRVTWDTKALDGYAAGHPEINQFRKEGEPSVSIRRV